MMTKTRSTVLETLFIKGSRWENEVCSPATGKALAALGWVERSPGAARGRLTSLRITQQGKIELHAYQGDREGYMRRQADAAADRAGAEERSNQGIDGA